MDKWEEVIENIQGTCLTLDEVINQVYGEEYEPTDLEYHQLDNTTLRCECCSWWVEAHEIDEEGNCHECGEQ